MTSLSLRGSCVARLELNFRSSSCSSHVCLHSSCNGCAVCISNTQGRFPVASVGGKYIQTSSYPQNREEKIKIDHENVTGDLGPGGWHRKLRMRRTKSDLLQVKAKGTLYTIRAELAHREDRVKEGLHLFAEYSCRIQIQPS